MTKLLVALLLFLGACTVPTDFRGLEGKTVVIRFGTQAQVTEFCSDAYRLDYSLACVGIPRGDYNHKPFHLNKEDVDCFIDSSPVPYYLNHELTLCARDLKDYWHQRPLNDS